MKIKQNKKWFENEKDLATKPLFNQIWFGFWLFGLVVSVRYLENSNDWKGYFLFIFSLVMLIFQQIWEWDMIIHYKNIDLNKAITN